MSVDWTFLIPIPASLLARGDYVYVDEARRGDDYIIESGGRCDPRVFHDAERQRALALRLTREHIDALRQLKAPREIVASLDGGPDGQARSYRKMRSIWRRELVLPDVVDEVLSVLDGGRLLPPLRSADVRIPLPPGTIRARLRHLDALAALEELRRGVPLAEARGKRAAVVVVDAVTDLDTVEAHYRAALDRLGIRPKVDKPSKWNPDPFVQMLGRTKGGDLVVSVTARPRTDDSGLAIGVLWIERYIEPSVEAAKAAEVRAPKAPATRSKRADQKAPARVSKSRAKK